VLLKHTAGAVKTAFPRSAWERETINLYVTTMMTHHSIRIFFQHLAQGYAWVLLMPSTAAGVVLIIATFAAPKLALIGLLGASITLLSARCLRVTEGMSSVYVFNGLLTGLFLASHYQTTLPLLLLLGFASVLVALITHSFAGVLWRFSQLPVLSLPFVLASWLAQLAANSYGRLVPIADSTHLSTNWADTFLASLGSIFFQPDPYLGAVLFITLLITSRTLAFLAVLGFSAGVAWVALFNIIVPPYFAPNWIFNAMLAAMATGGLFVVPSINGLLLSTISALLAALLAAAISQGLLSVGLTPLALPFLLSTWLCLYAAQRIGKPALVGERIQLPEKSLEDGRIALARLGNPASIALTPPFMGTWQVSQGHNGEHTHRGIWRDALDFIVIEDGRSFLGKGLVVEDFFCFGLPIVSPCYGQVIQLQNSIADNAIGEVNLRENWGNYLLIRLYDGAYILLAHLRQHSISVNVGDWLKAGQTLAQCGNSGRSPQPHLHFSVLRHPTPESETRPFHLIGVLLQAENSNAVFNLWANPAQNDRVTAAWYGVVRPLSLLVGSGRRYRVRVNGGQWQMWQLTPQLNLAGQFLLVSESGASCCCEENGAVFACYGREGSQDIFFNLWLLAVGCTPSSEQAKQWRDSPPTRLLPSRWHWLSVLLSPYATQLTANYSRSFDDAARVWRQSGEFSLLGKQVMTIETAIVANHGLTHLLANSAGQRWEMVLEGGFQTGDTGVPEREWAINHQPCIAI
jgi:urea transporter/murein DD-endopeptidase MepM/ murein hydrolase activator NlpD